MVFCNLNITAYRDHQDELHGNKRVVSCNFHLFKKKKFQNRLILNQNSSRKMYGSDKIFSQVSNYC